MLKTLLKKLRSNSAIALLFALIFNFSSILPVFAQGPYNLNIFVCNDLNNDGVCGGEDTMIGGAAITVQDKNEVLNGVTNDSGLYLESVNPQTVKITLDVGSVTSQSAYANATLTSVNPIDTSFGSDVDGGDHCTPTGTEGINVCVVDPGEGGDGKVFFTFTVPVPQNIIPTPGGSDISTDPCSDPLKPLPDSCKPPVTDPCLDTSKPLPDSCKPPVTDPCLDPLKPLPDSCKPPVTDPCLDTSKPLPDSCKPPVTDPCLDTSKPLPDSCKPPVTDPCLDTSKPLPTECTPPSTYSGGGETPQVTVSNPEVLAETGGPNIGLNLVLGVMMIASAILFLAYRRKEQN